MPVKPDSAAVRGMIRIIQPILLPIMRQLALAKVATGLFWCAAQPNAGSPVPTLFEVGTPGKMRPSWPRSQVARQSRAIAALNL